VKGETCGAKPFREGNNGGRREGKDRKGKQHEGNSSKKLGMLLVSA